MTSTRLPGKVLLDLAGEPMLARELDRLKRCERADELVIATTANHSDDPICALARQTGLRCFRGPEGDVLARYAGAAREARADVIVRITADCPLIDPEETDRVIAALEDGGADYASNVLERSYPRGLDAEAFTRDALDRAAREATSPSAREHVTFYMVQEQPERFALHSVKDIEDNSDLRWTVDTAEDLEAVRRIYEGLDLGHVFKGYRDVLRFVRAHPGIAAMNAHVRQKMN